MTTPRSGTPISTPTPRPEPPPQPPPPEPSTGVSNRLLGRGASLLGLAVSAVALAGVAWWALRQEPPALPRGSGQLAALAAAIALYAANTGVRAERWFRLLVDDGATPRRVDAYALTVIGYAANNVLPARAGDALRIVLAAPRAATSRRTVLGTLLAERLLDIAVLLAIFVVVGYGLFGEVAPGSPLLALALTAAVAGAAVVTIVLARRSHRLRAFIDPVLSSTLRLRSLHGAGLLAVTAAIWGLETGVWMLAAAAVGLHLSLMEGLYLVALASVFSLIPSGPGYAGTQDAAAVLGVRAVGGSGSLAVSFLLTLRFVLLVPITLAGLVTLALRYGGLRALAAR
jgi:uncharacterized membrane protein YbhN (UPF0104 family)